MNYNAAMQFHTSQKAEDFGPEELSLCVHVLRNSFVGSVPDLGSGIPTRCSCENSCHLSLTDNGKGCT